MDLKRVKIVVTAPSENVEAIQMALGNLGVA